jgi:hypothetical protein
MDMSDKICVSTNVLNIPSNFSDIMKSLLKPEKNHNQCNVSNGKDFIISPEQVQSKIKIETVKMYPKLQYDLDSDIEEQINGDDGFEDYIDKNSIRPFTKNVLSKWNGIKFLNKHELQRKIDVDSAPLAKKPRLTSLESTDEYYEYTKSVEKVCEDINQYQTLYMQKLENPDKIKEFLLEKITERMLELYKKINIVDADINYFIKNITETYTYKFYSLLKSMNINHIVSMVDYNSYDKTKTFEKFLEDEYYKLFYTLIINNNYGKQKVNLIDYIDEKWSSVNLEFFLNFTDILGKLSQLKISTKPFELLVGKKFDDEETIDKLINHINKNYIEKKSDESKIIDINKLDSNDFTKYNLHYIIKNMKSNGYLLFEKYYKSLQQRYETTNIYYVYNDLRLVKYFLNIISKNDNTNVNRYVNDILIKMRDYLFDIQSSHYNNQIYKKIKIIPTSEKYKDMNLSIFNRDLTTFKVLKYNYFTESNNILCSKYLMNMNNIEKKLGGYFDIYTSFYKTRYPDREIEFDLTESSIIVKKTFNNNTYLFHMALIQYLVLDKIMESLTGITIQQISDYYGIQTNKLGETLNSLLKIKLVKRSNEKELLKMKFCVNNDFTNENNKISIYELVKTKIKVSETPKEFLHDRNMIVLCNLINYAKKHTYFSTDTIIDDLSIKIPFKLTREYIEKAIEKAIEDEYLRAKEIHNKNGFKDIIYEYINE